MIDEKAFFDIQYQHKFKEKNIIFISVFQYVEYQKARLFGDNETAFDIIKSTSHKVIKKLGERIRNFNEELWKKNRNIFLIRGTYLKLIHCDELLDSIKKMYNLESDQNIIDQVKKIMVN